MLEGLLEWSLIRPTSGRLAFKCLWIHPNHYDLVPLGQLLLNHFGRHQALVRRKGLRASLEGRLRLHHISDRLRGNELVYFLLGGGAEDIASLTAIESDTFPLMLPLELRAPGFLGHARPQRLVLIIQPGCGCRPIGRAMHSRAGQ